MGKGSPGGRYPTAAGIGFSRLGYGAMQLAGPGVWGPPADRADAVRVLRTAVESGVDHVDTADFYGPHVTNEIIREALSPYDGVTVVTKVGAVRDEQGGWVHERGPWQLREQVESNLRTLGVDTLDVVNLRVGGGPDGHSPVPGSIAEQFGALAQMRAEGTIRHLGLSVVDADQVAEARRIAPLVTVQNWYNVAHRGDEDLIAQLADLGIAYEAFWPLGGFTPLQSGTLDDVARRLGSTAQAVAIAWLLHRSANMVVIPGTSRVEHLRQNIAAADLALPADALAQLDSIGA